MDAPTPFQSIWQYNVRSEFLTDFIEAYGPGGDWVKLFQQCPGYLRTELKQDIDDPDRFITIDFWHSRAAFSDMRQAIGDAYDQLDKKCEAYTSSERHLGFFR